ncbi:unnamed protein product [Brachionus calyciflorus]|uniref:Helicase C-terminal domain-containing protein n=1 Tax=Brachionus calyciflorus TaxID=104777 RepID=A0A814GSS5_9BILA|nr:unnamed protein product [Brachionus calyciflorus]
MNRLNRNSFNQTVSMSSVISSNLILKMTRLVQSYLEDIQVAHQDDDNILPLHSDIVINQQNRVFDRSEATWRKVIISTSIAESSITVPDVKYVIDFCLTKELYCDPYTNYSHLRLEWASVSSLD